MNIFRRHFIQSLRRSVNTKYSFEPCRSFAYKSSISLETLYPNSNLKIITPTKVAGNTSSPFSGYIPVDELNVTYSRSSGPGGQNVNKVSTKVDLRFHVKSASWITEEIKSKLLEQNQTKINKEGFLIIRSDKTRYQQLNLADAMERLRELVRAAAEPPGEISPETEEKLRRRREKNTRLRLMEKRAHSQNKIQRQAPTVDF